MRKGMKIQKPEEKKGSGWGIDTVGDKKKLWSRKVKTGDMLQCNEWQRKLYVRSPTPSRRMLTCLSYEARCSSYLSGDAIVL